MRLGWGLLLCLAVMGGLAIAQVQGGDFSNAPVGVQPKGSTQIPGWQVVGGTVEIMEQHNSRYVWLGGQAGGLRQDIPTRPGQMYRLFLTLYGIHSGVLNARFGDRALAYATVPESMAVNLWMARWVTATTSSTALQLQADPNFSTEISVKDVQVSPANDLSRIDPEVFVQAYEAMNKSGLGGYYTSDFVGRNAEGQSYTLSVLEDGLRDLEMRRNLYDLHTDPRGVVTADVQTINFRDGVRNVFWQHDSWLKARDRWQIYATETFAHLQSRGNTVVVDIHPPGFKTWWGSQ